MRWIRTLTEVVLTASICLILTALILPRMFGHSGAHFAKSKSDITELSNALDRFRGDAGRYPTWLEGLNALVVRPQGVKAWNGPYVQKIPHDEWDHPYIYSRIHNVAKITGYGADGQPGGTGPSSDISNLDDMPTSR